MEQVKDIWLWQAGILATAGMSPASDEMQQAGSAGELPALSRLPGSRQVKGLVGAGDAVRPLKFHENVGNGKVKAKGLGIWPRSPGNIMHGHSTLEGEWCRKHELSCP